MKKKKEPRIIHRCPGCGGMFPRHATVRWRKENWCPVCLNRDDQEVLATQREAAMSGSSSFDLSQFPKPPVTFGLDKTKITAAMKRLGIPMAGYREQMSAEFRAAQDAKGEEHNEST